MAEVINPLPTEKDPDGGTLNLTRFSGLAAALIAVLTAFEDSWDTIFGESTPEWSRPVAVIAIIASWSLIAASDILARGYAAGRREQIVAMPEGLEATLDEPGTNPKISVAGVRFNRKVSGDADFLVVKSDGKFHWATREEINFPTAAT
jgi:hypothetical protein